MLSSASLPFSSSDSGHQKWKLRCWNSSSKPRRLDLRHRRRRHRGPAAVAKRKARAVAHQASLAMPPPPPPLPPPTSTQRLIKVVQRKPGSRSSFSQLDGESGGEVDSEEDRVPPPPESLVCASNCKTMDQHCWNCGRCFGLCPEHSGCTCEPEEEEEIENLCSICHCFLSVRYPDESRKYPYMTGLSDSHPNKTRSKLCRSL